MTYIVLAPIAVRTRQGSLMVNTGQVISLPQDKAILLLHQGKIALSPELQEALEERSAIMKYDGGLDPEEAERLAWCRTACMLSFPSQWRECEKFNHKLCLKLINQSGE